MLLRYVAPSLKARLVEHLGEEEVYGHGLVLLEVKFLNNRLANRFRFLVLQCDLRDAVLSHQLLHCHDLVQFKTDS